MLFNSHEVWSFKHCKCMYLVFQIFVPAAKQREKKTAEDTPDGCGWPWTMYTYEITFFCIEINLNENKYDCLRSGKITKFRVNSDHKTSSFPKLNNFFFFFHESMHLSVVWQLYYTVQCSLACKSYGKYCSLIRNWSEWEKMVNERWESFFIICIWIRVWAPVRIWIESDMNDKLYNNIV